MSCPWCGFDGKLLKATKPRPSSKRTRMCPDCYGQVDHTSPTREEHLRSRVQFLTFLEEELSEVPRVDR